MLDGFTNMNRAGKKHRQKGPKKTDTSFTNIELDPQMREVLTDQSFATSTLGLSHAEQLDHHFRQLHQVSSSPCACGADHGDGSLDFPEDSYEDEPDDEDEEDDEDEDEDHDHEGEEDDDSMDDDEDIDDEVYDDEDDEQDVVDGYAHHYEESNVKMMAYEEEKLKLEAVRRVRDEERRLKEEFRKKKISERLKQKQEKGRFFWFGHMTMKALCIPKRETEHLSFFHLSTFYFLSFYLERILLLQRLRLEDEERRKREAQERLRREKLEEEMRKKREAGKCRSPSPTPSIFVLHQSTKDSLDIYL